MNLAPKDLEAAVSRGIISQEQAAALLAHGGGAPVGGGEARVTSAAVEALAALGGVLASGAVGLALFLSWSRLGGIGVAAVAGASAAGAGAGARALWRRHRFGAGGLLAAVAALLVPVAAFGLLEAAGLWSSAHAPWHEVAPWAGGGLWVALAAAAALALALRAFPFPPLAALLAGAGWFVAQACAPLFFGPHPGWQARAIVSVATGVVVVAAGLAVSGRARQGVPDWLFVAGLVALRGGVAGIGGDGGGVVAARLAVDLALIAGALPLRRPVFALFGVLGIAAGVGGAAEAGGVAGLVTTAAVAVGLTAAAALYARRRAELEARWGAPMRAALQRLLPHRHAH